MEEDIDRFSRLESAAQWQIILAREVVQFGAYLSMHVFSTLGSTFQVQYFFEADASSLLVVGFTFGAIEAVSATRFDFRSFKSNLNDDTFN